MQTDVIHNNDLFVSHLIYLASSSIQQVQVQILHRLYIYIHNAYCHSHFHLLINFVLVSISFYLQ